MAYKSPGFFQLICRLILHLVGWVLAGSVFSLLIALVIVAWCNERQGLTQLQLFIEQNYSYLIAHVGAATGSNVNAILQQMAAVSFKVNQSLSVAFTAKSLFIIQLLKPLLRFVDAFLLGIQLLMLRFYLLLQWSWLFLFLGVVGIVDGLTQRCIRREGVGRESAIIYHHARSLITFSLVMGIFLVLTLPISVRISVWIMVGFAISFGFSLQVTLKYFKKYL